MTQFTIHSPMVTGSGAWILHQILAENLKDYCMQAINPLKASFSPLLILDRNDDCSIIHTAPDLGPYILPRSAIKILTFHNFYFDKQFRAYTTPMQQLYYQTLLKYSIIEACKKADVLVAVSDFVANKIYENLPQFNNKIKIIKNGIDVTRFSPIKKTELNKIKILYVGNISRRKGKQILLEIAKRLPKNCILQITLGLRDSTISKHPNIELVGNVPYKEMHKLYQQADILFFPTIREGFGLCVAEAMACGLPVVSTNHSAIPELVNDKKGGLLCEINNLPQMLEAIKKLSNDRKLRNDMGAYNREKAVKEFDSKRMIEEYQSVFSSFR
jgi:L-malate glycosyltransferase